MKPMTSGLILLFGALAGVFVTLALVTSFNLFSFQSGSNAADNPGIFSATPGMDLLSAYECTRSETKQIILGGIEDNYSVSGDEEIDLDEVHDDLVIRTNGFVSFRDFDEMGQDKLLLQRFEIPSRTRHGLFVTRLKPLSGLPNDTVSIGPELWEQGVFNGYSLILSDIENDVNWQKQGDVIYSEVHLMEFMALQKKSTDYKNGLRLIDYVRSQDESVPLYVSVTDDTAVDFIGFALCLEPEFDKGLTYHIIPDKELPAGLVNLSCIAEDGEYCNAYSGDQLCEKSFPLACFRPQLKPPPEDFRLWSISTSWSGGDIAFTAPVRGTDFRNVDDVHAFCRVEFGEGWRAASLHDGNSSSGITGFGKAEDVSEVWVTIMDQVDGNCWAPRESYQDVSRSKPDE